MIGCIKDKTANSTVIAELEEAIWSNTIANEERLPTQTATLPAPSNAISIVALATSSDASGATSNAAGAPSFAGFVATSSVIVATLSVYFKSPESPPPAVLVHQIVETQHAATLHFAAATQDAAVATLHADCPITLNHRVAAWCRYRSAVGAQPASTPQRASTTLCTGTNPATV